MSAVDVDRDGIIDFDGLDRVSRTTGGYATAHGTTVRRITTEVWDVDNTDSPRTVSVVESSVDGLRSWSSSAGLNSSSEVQLDGTGGRTEISISPQQVRSERVFLNDRLQSATIFGSDDQPVLSQSFTYDSHARLHQQIDYRTGATTYTYFADDQIETITTPDPDATRSGPGYDSQVTTFAYDTAGRQSTVTQPDATVVTQEFYPNGLVKMVTGSRSYPQQFTYDAQGRIKTLTTWQDYVADTGAAVTTWNYDPARGWLANKRYADNDGPSYTYWPSGRLKTRTWARGLVTTYGYSSAGDLQSVDYDDTTPDVTHTYDRLGQVRVTIDAAGTLTRGFTTLGQLDDETYSGTTALAGQIVARAFDPMARLQSLTVSAATPVTYGYDTASRLQTVTRGGSVATYGYLPGSALVQSLTIQQDGATRLSAVKAHDMLGRLSSVVNTPSAAGVQSFVYDYNAANQRSRATREDGTYWDYGYDTLGQVTGATKRLADGSAAVGAAHGFTFDDIGNRETATVNGRVSTYTPTALNQYTQRTVPSSVEVLGTAHPEATVTVNMEPTTRQGDRFVGGVDVDNAPAAVWAEAHIVGVRNLQGPQGEDAVTEETRRLLVPRSPEASAYDLDGNLTGDGRWAYTWDGENRLVAMETPAALVDPAGPLPQAERRRLEFAYDSSGRRISKKVYSWDGAVWTLAAHRVFLYDGWNMVAEYHVAPDGVGLTLERSATWGLDLSGSTQGAGGVAGLLWIADNSASCAAAYDGNGNVTALVDTATGTLGGDFEYGPFGELLKASGPAVSVSPFRFSTKFTDAETDLVYYGYRYYNPAIGRWLSRDPIEEDGGLNLYGMVDNDPISYFDDLGTAKRRESWSSYWARWQAAHPGLTPSQYTWAEQHLAAGCIGVTCVNLGEANSGMPDLSNCFRKKAQAEAKQKEMQKNCACPSGRNPSIFSVHLWNDKGTNSRRRDVAFNRKTGKADLSNWNRSGRPAGKWNSFADNNGDGIPDGGVNFDFGWGEPNGTLTHADMYHNPDADGDGRGDYFPGYPIRTGTIYNSDLADWQGRTRRGGIQYDDFNTEVWCVACDGGSYGK